MNLVVYPSREAWLADRRTFLGGSDVAEILDGNGLAVWARKVGLEMPEMPDSYPLRAGAAMEPFLADELKRDAGLVRVELYGCEAPAVARHPAFPFLAASLDGLAWTSSECSVAEFKRRSAFTKSEWDDGIPDKVMWQVQHAIDVTCLASAYVMVDLGSEGRWMRVERDPLWAVEVRPRLIEFWKMIESETPPAPQGGSGDRDALTARFPREVEGKTVALPGEAVDLAYAYRDASEASKRAKDEASLALDKLAAMVGDAECGLLPGDLGRVTYKQTNVKARVQEAYSFRVPRVNLKKDG